MLCNKIIKKSNISLTNGIYFSSDRPKNYIKMIMSLICFMKMEKGYLHDILFFCSYFYIFIHLVTSPIIYVRQDFHSKQQTGTPAPNNKAASLLTGFLWESLFQKARKATDYQKSEITRCLP